MSIVGFVRRKLRAYRAIPGRLESIQEALGRIELRQIEQAQKRDLREWEFKAFSQFGEDGILQYLIRNIPEIQRVFVEFGASDYEESNTRFLLQHDNWVGLVLDGSSENIDFIRRQPYFWRHTLKAECAFVDRDNINDLLRRGGTVGDIGILSIDIDGNDYWVWQAIDCVNPAIVVCEYNSLFGSERKVTVPYAPDFLRSRAHYSCLYFGASLGALTALASSRGYALVGSTSAGNNAFFVRRDLLGSLPEQNAQQAYAKARFREARNENGNLDFLDFDAAVRLISSMPLDDLESGRTVTVADVYRAG